MKPLFNARGCSDTPSIALVCTSTMTKLKFALLIG